MQSEFNRIRYIKEKKKHNDKCSILDMFHQFGRVFSIFPNSSLYFISCSHLFGFHRNTKIQHVQTTLAKSSSASSSTSDLAKWPGKTQEFGAFSPKKTWIDSPNRKNMFPVACLQLDFFRKIQNYHILPSSYSFMSGWFWIFGLCMKPLRGPKNRKTSHIQFTGFGKFVLIQNTMSPWKP